MLATVSWPICLPFKNACDALVTELTLLEKLFRPGAQSLIFDRSPASTSTTRRLGANAPELPDVDIPHENDNGMQEHIQTYPGHWPVQAQQDHPLQ